MQQLAGDVIDRDLRRLRPVGLRGVGHEDEAVVLDRQVAGGHRHPLHGVPVVIVVLVDRELRLRAPRLCDEAVRGVGAGPHLDRGDGRGVHVVPELAADPKLDALLRLRDGGDTIAVAVGVLDSNYDVNGFYDEMLAAAGRPRAPYGRLYEELNRLGPVELQRRWSLAMEIFRNHGITFAVYPDAQGTE